MTSSVHAAIAPTGTRGQLLHSILDGDIATYCATMVGITAVSGDIFQIQGIANGVVRITHIDISIQAVSAAAAAIAIQRRSTASTGGGQSGINNTRNDAGDPSPTSVPSFYSSTPVPGIPVGTPRTYPILVTATSTLPNILSLDYGFGPHKALTLRGASDFFTFALSGSLGGATATINVEWTESPT